MKIGAPFLLVLMVAFLSWLAASMYGPPWEWYARQDLSHYYASARILIQGKSPYAEPLDAAYKHYNLRNSPPIDYATNPPALVALFVPFSLFSPAEAFVLWSLFQFISLIIALFLMVRQVSLEPRVRIMLWLSLVSLSAFPVANHFEFCQVQLLVLLLITVGLVLIDESPGWKAPGYFLWGLTIALKFFTWPLLLLGFSRGGRRGVCWILAGFIVPTMSVALIEPTMLLDFVWHGLPLAMNFVVRFFLGSATLLGAILHGLYVLTNGTVRLSVKLILMSQIAINLVGAGLFWCLLKRFSSLPLSYLVALTVMVSCLIAPTGWPHYLTLLLLPLVILYREFMFRREDRVRWWIAYLLYALPMGRLSYIFPGQAIWWSWYIVGQFYLLGCLLYTLICWEKELGGKRTS